MTAQRDSREGLPEDDELTARFRQQGGPGNRRTRSLLRRIWPFVRPHSRPLVGSLLLLPLSAGLQLLPPYLLKVAIDDAILPRRFDHLAWIAAVLIATIVAQQIAAFGQALLLQLSGQHAMHALRQALHRHVLRLRTHFFDQTPVGKIVSRVTNDIESIAEAFASGVVAVVGDAIRIVGIIAMMLWLHPTMALLTLSVVPLLFVMAIVFQRLLRRAHLQIRERLGQINGTLQEQLAGIKIVQVFGRQASSQAAFDNVNRGYRDAYLSVIRLDAALFALVEMLSSVTIAALLWYGLSKIFPAQVPSMSGTPGAAAVGGVTLGLLAAFIEYVQRFFEPIRDISTKYAVMQQALAASERVLGLLDLDLTETSRDAEVESVPAESPPPPRSDGGCSVELVDLRFDYRADAPLFDHLSLRVEAGEQVAVVGPTGAGKSTLARLLIRLYEPSVGSILLGGTDLREIPLAELRRRIVVVNQDVFLFAGTVRDNISLGDRSLSQSAIEEAAERVGLPRLLALDREVIERGANLSLGERQLVAFARALVRRPEVLVLDEATASVDPVSEELVQQGIIEVARQRTALVIAHRLTTIERADRILVLDHGRLVEQGPHETLRAAGGLYSKLYQLQFARRRLA